MLMARSLFLRQPFSQQWAQLRTIPTTSTGTCRISSFWDGSNLQSFCRFLRKSYILKLQQDSGLELYSRPPLSQIVELQREMRLCHRGGLSCCSYIEKMMSFADELASLGAPISDRDLMSKMSLNLNLGPVTGHFLLHYTAREACGLLSLKGLHKLALYYENLLSSQSEAPRASPNKPKRDSCQGTDKSRRRHSYPISSQGHPLAPTSSTVDRATSPGPRGRGRGRSSRGCGPSLHVQPPQETPQLAFPLVPLQFPVASAASSSASNEGCIPHSKPVNQGSPPSPTS